MYIGPMSGYKTARMLVSSSFNAVSCQKPRASISDVSVLVSPFEHKYFNFRLDPKDWSLFKLKTNVQKKNQLLVKK